MGVRLTPILVFISALAGLPAASDSLDVAVMEHGGDGQATNCASRVVSRLKEGGDGFLAVRSGPSTQYRQVDQLHNGDVVFEFERRGAWVGACTVFLALSAMRCRTGKRGGSTASGSRCRQIEIGLPSK